MEKILIVVAFILLTTVGYAQDTFKPETNFGIKVGGNISGVFFSPEVSQNINPGFTGGVVFKHISQKSLGIQIELNYIQKGWDEDSTSGYTRQLNYLELPFMTHVCLGKGRTRFLFNVGPYLSYLLSEREKTNLAKEDLEKDYYGEKIHNSAGFGLCAGSGISRYTNIGQFQLEARGAVSLSDLFKSTSDISFDSSKNLSFELGLSYLLDYEKVKELF